MISKEKLSQIQNHLKKNRIDAWLIYQFIDLNPIFDKILGGQKQIVTRRTFLAIPQQGKPFLIHSRIDGGLSNLNLPAQTYVSYQEFKQVLKKTTSKYRKVAIEYSPLSAIPHISKVDAGIVDLLRNFGLETISSGDLMQLVNQFTDQEIKSHLQAAKELDQIRKETFIWLEKSLTSQKKINEYTIQQEILTRFNQANLDTVFTPQCVINENAARGHYQPSQNQSKELKKGDLLLIDMWLKLKGEKNIYADITWMLFRGNKIPEKIKKAFFAIVTARDKAIGFLRQRIKSNQQVRGWEVDKVARDYLQKRGYEKNFTNRLGHSIGTFVHGDQTHLDSHENKDDRLILPNHISSVEPCLKFPGQFGIRTEVDILVTQSDVIVTTEVQNKIYQLP
ncbi:MAG: aminopeptidase P family protein [Candidatus Pacebacteria bacterium]|nr:aminopeptidase P family protein [Candidatus Paceibacterota bacterium]